MSDETPPESGEHPIVQAVGDPTDLSEAQVDAYDLDDDGKISIVETERARLGIVDARLEEIAEEGGIKGAIADLAHKVVDKFDNDESG